MTLPSDATLASMLDACERRYRELTNGGCDEGVAADRTFDAYECALEDGDKHCFDSRDRLFENKLRTIKNRQESR